MVVVGKVRFSSFPIFLTSISLVEGFLYEGSGLFFERPSYISGQANTWRRPRRSRIWSDLSMIMRTPSLTSSSDPLTAFPPDLEDIGKNGQPYLSRNVLSSVCKLIHLACRADNDPLCNPNLNAL